MARITATKATDADFGSTIRRGRGELFAMIPEWVLYHSDLSPQDVRVYAVLARYANDKDGSCYPGQETIAAHIGVAHTTVSRAIAALRAVGAVDVEAESYNNGMRRRNHYVVHFDAPVQSAVCTDAQETLCTDARSDVHPRGGNQNHLQPERVEPEPERTISLTPVERSLDVTFFDPFDAFWDAYPKRVGKAKAREAWKKLLKRGASDRDMTAGAVAYARWVEASGTERQFIAHPATWLNAERWTDELVVEHRNGNGKPPKDLLAGIRAGINRS